MSSLIGGEILKNCQDVTVDVRKPQITVQIEIRDKAYVYTEVVKCQGGMPYKTAGRAMLLLSGGIDSPVAAFMMARRGLEIEAVHFHSYPFTSERAQEKVYDLARKLAIYTGRVRIHSVNLLNIQKQIGEKCPSEEMTILSRRFMMAIATKIAEDRDCKALITGESLGQVASQTIEGINVTTDATHLPVFRPLISMDKVDIMDLAKKIDTYETSILPFEDCCTVFLPDRVVTKPKVDVIRASEALLDKDKLISDAIESMEIIIVKGEESYEM
jgi:thiamine biosynthesis protein ThiI